jgi:predicted dienelactone hydrolase
MPVVPYDPFARGPFPVGVRGFHVRDGARGRLFPCEIWYPAASRHAGQDTAEETRDVFTVPGRDARRGQSAVRDAAAEPGRRPLVVYSHPGGFHRLAATFLRTHLASHGYVVAAMDHSEVAAPKLARRQNETAAQKAARVEGTIASRVPDVSFLLDCLQGGAALPAGVGLDPDRIAMVGHSFGGWTALAAPEVDSRVRAVVAQARGGASNPMPGVLPLKLDFRWTRDVPTLYLAAGHDTPLPLAGMIELFERTPATKQMFILRNADHAHFLDAVEEEHERVRAMAFGGELAWIPKAMRPAAELCSGEEAHLFTRGLTLCHLDAYLAGREGAREFLRGDVEAELAARGVDAVAHRSGAAHSG